MEFRILTDYGGQDGLIDEKMRQQAGFSHGSVDGTRRQRGNQNTRARLCSNAIFRGIPDNGAIDERIGSKAGVLGHAKHIVFEYFDVLRTRRCHGRLTSRLRLLFVLVLAVRCACPRYILGASHNQLEGAAATIRQRTAIFLPNLFITAQTVEKDLGGQDIDNDLGQHRDFASSVAACLFGLVAGACIALFGSRGLVGRLGTTLFAATIGGLFTSKLGQGEAQLVGTNDLTAMPTKPQLHLLHSFLKGSDIRGKGGDLFLELLDALHQDRHVLRL